jgi:uncharacterized protein (DUF302 family)
MNTLCRFVIAAVCLGLAPGLTLANDGPYAVYRSESGFADVMQALKLAIEEKGLYINDVMQMSEMLERTGKDLGLEQKLYLEAESIEFCSAILSRKMTAEARHRIVNCPFILSVYTTPEEPDVTYIVHRRLSRDDDSEVMREVEAMLESLGKAAAEAW